MGQLPNRFPDEGQAPEYNTVDATLWYFEAIRAYHTATGDTSLVRDLFPVLADIVGWHVRGTRYQIHVDPADGLLYAGEPGVQLTWMDAKVDDWVVTPRIGKPGDLALARSFLQPLLQQLESHCVGNLSETFDGDPPHTPRGCIAQASTVTEVLRVWREIQEMGRSFAITAESGWLQEIGLTHAAQCARMDTKIAQERGNPGRKEHVHDSGGSHRDQPGSHAGQARDPGHENPGRAHPTETGRGSD